MEKASDISNAEKLVFPGVGAFGQAMKVLQERGYTEALKDYIKVRGTPGWLSRGALSRELGWGADGLLCAVLGLTGDPTLMTSSG